MKIAFAEWENRIAPVFDTSQQLHVVEIEAGNIVSESRVILPETMDVHKALRLAELSINVLVCGAISRSLHGLVASYGVQVIPFVAGELPTVVRAWQRGNLMQDTFSMPGCRGRGRQRFRGTHNTYKEMTTMRGKGQSSGQGRGGGGGQGRGGGQGGGRGQSQAGQQRPGRMGGGLAAGPTGFCVCPECGQRVPHQRGMPCVERKCPNCGVTMIRE